MIRALYILGNHIQALGVARMADKINLRVHLFSDYSASITRYSKSCHSFSKYRDEDHLLEILTDRLETDDSPVLIPTNDRMVDFMKRHNTLLNKYYAPGTYKSG